jgi:hypothetical protein
MKAGNRVIAVGKSANTANRWAGFRTVSSIGV